MDKKVSQKTNKLNDEIDITDIFRPIWERRVYVGKISLVFAIMGLVVSLLSEKTYTTEVSFIPQSSRETGSIGGQLGGLADLAGFDLGAQNKSNEFPPSLYPLLLENIDFQLKVLSAPLYLEGWGDSLTYQQYYLDVYKPSILSRIGDYTIDLPFKLLAFITGGNKSAELQVQGANSVYKKLSKNEKEVLDIFFSQVNINPNIKQGYVSVSMSMPDPFLTAQMANHVQSLIDEYLVDYKTQKALQELNFIEDNFEQKKEEFQTAQNRLSSFQDRNLSLSTVSAKNELRILENEYDLAMQVYMNLATKLEEAKLNLSKNTPLLTIIKPVTVPLKRSGPRTVFNTVIGGLLGVFIALLMIFFNRIKNKLVGALNTGI